MAVIFCLYANVRMKSCWVIEGGYLFSTFDSFAEARDICFYPFPLFTILQTQLATVLQLVIPEFQSGHVKNRASTSIM